MHIAEGVLSAPILVGSAVGALAAVGVGLKKLPDDDLLTAGLIAAAFFVASLIHIPIGVSSAHLILNGLVGIVFGWGAYPVIFVALLLQGILFMFGGLTVLGVNTLTMGTGALVAGFVFRLMARTHATPMNDVAAFVAGFLGVLVSALLTAVALGASDEGFVAAATALFVAHLPIMLAEGVITLFVVRYLRRSGHPALFKGLRP